MNKRLKFVITGGGSGGHLMPALSIIQKINVYCKKNGIENEILYIGSKRGIEKDLVLKKNINFKSISTGKLRRYVSLKNITDIFRIIKGIIDSFCIIKKYKPVLIISTGGFVTVPVVIAGKIQKIPVLIHEQTVDAGLANKIASKFATKIALTFQESAKYFPENKVIVTGIPLRDEIFKGNKDKALKRFNFDPSLPVLYFTGGGLGCSLLNKLSQKIIPELLDRCNIIFQTGNSNGGKDYQEILKLKENLSQIKQRRFVVYNFVNEEISDIFAITDLTIGRSGAGTVNELLALKIPAIFIPLAISTNNEQLKNAQIIANLGGAAIIEEKNLDSETLLNMINNIVFTKKIDVMKENLNKCQNHNADSIIEVIMEIINIDTNRK